MALVRMWLDAGSDLSYPEEHSGESYLQRLVRDASPQVRKVLEPFRSETG